MRGRGLQVVDAPGGMLSTGRTQRAGAGNDADFETAALVSLELSVGCPSGSDRGS